MNNGLTLTPIEITGTDINSREIDGVKTRFSFELTRVITISVRASIKVNRTINVKLGYIIMNCLETEIKSVKLKTLRSSVKIITSVFVCCG